LSKIVNVDLIGKVKDIVAIESLYIDSSFAFRLKIDNLLGKLLLKLFQNVEWFEMSLIRLPFKFGNRVVEEHLD
jgi:hypothetical protein